MNRLNYVKMRQAMRINKDTFCYDTMLYWANGDKTMASRLYDSAWGEPDHLSIRAKRLYMGCLIVSNGRLSVGPKDNEMCSKANYLKLSTKQLKRG